jgi:hypothetical protein
MKAFVIPANASERVREDHFDWDKSWRYVVKRYNDPGKPPGAFTEVAFLTKENAHATTCYGIPVQANT